MRWILPVAPFGISVTKTICFGTLNGGELLAEEVAQLGLADLLALDEHDRGADLLAELVVRDGERDGLGDGRVARAGPRRPRAARSSRRRG